jgi:hypothetical protein
MSDGKAVELECCGFPDTSPQLLRLREYWECRLKQV